MSNYWLEPAVGRLFFQTEGHREGQIDRGPWIGAASWQEAEFLAAAWSSSYGFGDTLRVVGIVV